MSRPSLTDIEALFKLPLGEFTTARNALAAQLKKDGLHAEATETRALAKPSASAWVVNQLYWRHRKLFDGLIAAGDRPRRAPAAERTGDAARDRRERVAELAAVAADLLREGSHGGNRDLLRRVTSTLDALSSYGSQTGTPTAGRLTDDVEPPGFEAALGFARNHAKRAASSPRARMRSPGAKPTTRRPSRPEQSNAAERRVEEDRKRLVAARKAAVRAAERTVNVARKQAERAATNLETAAKRAKGLEAQRAQIEKRFARISKDAEAARADTREAAANADQATRAVADAERALQLARDGATGTPLRPSR